MRTDWSQAWSATSTGSLDEPGGAWVPPLDILEGPDGLEIRVDVAGVAADALMVTVRLGRLIIEGHKATTCGQARAFHVAERTTGRFSRSLPLRMPFDAGAIRARLEHGELRIRVPRITERRGRTIRVPIETA
jgi:HSP20 family molecular chaperone IbpA